MPRLYMTPDEVKETPLGIGLSSSIANLTTEAFSKALARASASCDSECRRRLQAPGSTTLAQSCSPGATQISVSSTLTLDALDEQAVQIGTETILIKPGGVTVTNWAGLYPGTINLASATQFSHSSGDPVVFLYKETTEAGGSSSSDPYAEAMLTQEAEIAYAHMPSMSRGGLTRVVFLRNYPIINISAIEHAFSFSSQFSSVDTSIEIPVPHGGWYRFEPGSVILREGIMRTTYTGGFQTVPEDVKEACSLFFAVQMRMQVNPYGLIEESQGKRRRKWAANGGDKDPLVEKACRKLKKYRRSV
jgi:hypothetical protein